MSYMRSYALALFCGLATAVPGGLVEAASIGFEAESGAISGFATASDPLASGGAYITGENGDTADYSVDFTETGAWYLYARVLNTEPGGTATNDSFFAPNSYADFGTAGDTINGVTSSFPTGRWAWLAINSGATGTPQFGDTGPSNYNVTATGPVTMQVGGREDGFHMDHFVLSTDASLNPTALEGMLPNVATPNDDTYGRRGGTGEVHGLESEILVKKEGSTGSGGTTRKGVIEFNTSGLKTANGVFDGASLLLDVSQMNGTSADFLVWGVLDGAGIEDFDESTANYNTFAPPFDDSGDGTNNDENVLYDGDPGGNAQALGQFSIVAADLNETVEFTSQALIDWLNTDTNGIATVILTRLTDNVSMNTAFASSEHGSLIGPRLLVSVQVPAPAALPAGLALMAAVGLRRRR